MPGAVSPGRNSKTRIGLLPLASPAFWSTSCRVAARMCWIVSLVIGSVIVKNWPGVVSAGRSALGREPTRSERQAKSMSKQPGGQSVMHCTGANHGSRTPPRVGRDSGSSPFPNQVSSRRFPAKNHKKPDRILGSGD